MITDELMASIRRLIGVDETLVPDDMILDPLIGGVVQHQIELYLGKPPFEERPADEQKVIRDAAGYLIASRLLGTRELRKASSAESEKFGDQYTVSHNSSALDIDSWRTDLKNTGMGLLEPLRRSRKGGTMFTTAAGRRGA